MDRLKQVELFVRTAELNSLSKAAELLGMSNAAASRYLRALEERLGARLIERNTRRQWLTDAGEEFYERCTSLLSGLGEAEAAVSARSASPAGLIRVTSSLSFSLIYLAPVLPAFRALYPKLDVQVVVANRYLDFIEAGIDVAVRTREHEPDSGIVVRRLCTTRRVLAASPDYLARRGVPRTPDDLAGHDMLVYNLANEPYMLHLRREQASRKVRISSVLDTNDGQIVRVAAIAGHGILIQPTYIVHEDIASGRLKVVLEDWQLPPLTMNIAYQNRQFVPGKIRAFSEFLIERVRQVEQERERFWAEQGAGRA